MPTKARSHSERMRAARLPVERARYNVERAADPDRQWYSRREWRTTRAHVLARRPLCEDRCQELGLVTPATEVHHVIERRDRPDLAFDPNNLQACCKSCHSRHTARAHGFGGRK